RRRWLPGRCPKPPCRSWRRRRRSVGRLRLANEQRPAADWDMERYPGRRKKDRAATARSFFFRSEPLAQTDGEHPSHRIAARHGVGAGRIGRWVAVEQVLDLERELGAR